MSEVENLTQPEPAPDAVKQAKGTRRSRRMKSARGYNRHGLTVLKARILVQGMTAVDRRSASAQALLAWKRDLLNDLGGESAVSSQKAALVDMICRTRLYIDSLDAWLMRQPGLVRNRKKSVLPVLRERQGLVDSLAMLLSKVGLERTPKPVPSLSEYLVSKTASKPEG
jgi:hypothetical protein